MEVLGQGMVWRLGLAAIIALAGLGCGSNSGPNDPTMSPAQEKQVRANMYTPEQLKARDSRPR